MTIKQHGGIFGRNPTFNNVTVEGVLTASGLTLSGLNIVDGNIVMASGKGIDFSATSGTGTSELFDDYEEGTWTPEYLGSTGSPTVTYDVQSGKYTKIGNLVIARFELGTDLVSGGSGDLRIGGLPYLCSGENSGQLGLAYNFNTSLGGAIYYISSSQTYFTINTTANSSAKAPVTSLASTANTNRMFAHVVYMTS